MPDGTQREVKGTQGQKWPRKNLLSNFPMMLKVAPFASTNHSISNKIYFGFVTWGLFNTYLPQYWLVRMNFKNNFAICMITCF